MRSYTVVFTQVAALDLRRIRAHIGLDNPAAGSRLAIQIAAACDRLEYLPERGRLGLVADTRELTAVWPYVIVYRIQAETVEILRVWHGAQNR